MRRLQWFVLGESALTLFLGIAWLAGVARGGTVDAPPQDGHARNVGHADVGAAETVSSGAPDAAMPTSSEPSLRTAVEPGTAPSVLLRGRLLVDDGSPWPENAGGYLSLRRGSVWRSATIVASGEYAIAALTPGDWEAMLRSDEFAKRAESVRLGTEPVQTRDFVFARAQRVEVFVRTPDGKRLVSALESLDWRLGRSLDVVAFEQPLASDLPATINSTVGEIGIGRYRSNWSRSGQGPPKDGEPDGVLLLDRAPPATAALLLRNVVLRQQPIGAGQQQITFTLDLEQVKARTGTVRLRVIDGQSGQPLAGVNVGLSTAQGGGPGAKVAADGLFVAANQIPGVLRLSITAKDREQVNTIARVPPGGDVDLGEVRLYPPATIRGKLLDVNGVPVAGSVYWTDLDMLTFPSELNTQSSNAVDGDGEFQLWGVGPRRGIVLASVDGAVGHAVVDARGGQVEPITIRLQQAVAIEVVVGGDPLAGYVLTLRDGDGVPVAAVRVEPRWRNPSLRVPPGDYTLEVHGAGDRLIKRVPIAARGETLTVEVP